MLDDTQKEVKSQTLIGKAMRVVDGTKFGGCNGRKTTGDIG